MIIWKIYTMLVTWMTCSKCFRVIDEFTRKGVHVAKYCPSYGICQEGTHVICMYYNPHRRLGPMCSHAQNITINSEYAKRILEIVNGIRSQVSRGLEKGKNGEALPRGYGMYKVMWDEELATFAQLWADQCTMTRDKCRATSKFSDPGQAAGLNRFTIDDWMPVKRTVKFTTPGFSSEKVFYALYHIIKSFYAASKQVITPELIKNDNMSPERQKLLEIHPYLQLLYGSITHMGCGISAFREFAYYDDALNLLFDTIRLVCNFSKRLVTGIPLYNTKRPTEEGYTVKCGCPPDYDEDENCLCYQSVKLCPNNQCAPQIVLLPIFTTEDAPPDKVISNDRKLDTVKRKENQRNKQNFTPDVYRYPPKNHILSNNSDIGSKSKNWIISQKTLFNKPVKYKKMLPSSKNSKAHVKPRKDFSNLQVILDQYVHGRRNHFSTINGKNNISVSHKTSAFRIVSSREITIRPRDYHVSVSNLNNEYKFYNDDNKLDYFNRIKSPTDEKVLLLLNKLEKELQNMNLGLRDRKIIDERIKSVYKAILEKHDSVENEYKSRNEMHYHGDHSHDRHGRIPNTIIHTKDLEDRYIDHNFQHIIENNDFNNVDVNNYKNDRNEDVAEDINVVNSRTDTFRNTFDIRRSESIKKEEVDVLNRHTNKNINIDDMLNYKTKSEFLNTLDNLEETIRHEQNHRPHEIVLENNAMPGNTEVIEDDKRKKEYYILDRAQLLYGV